MRRDRKSEWSSLSDSTRMLQHNYKMTIANLHQQTQKMQLDEKNSVVGWAVFKPKMNSLVTTEQNYKQKSVHKKKKLDQGLIQIRVKVRVKGHGQNVRFHVFLVRFKKEKMFYFVSVAVSVCFRQDNEKQIKSKMHTVLSKPYYGLKQQITSTYVVSLLSSRSVWVFL